MSKNIVMICSLDTKGEESKYLKELIQSRGMNTILMDTGFGGEAMIPGDISSEEVAKAAGGDIHGLRASRDTGEASRIMTKGAIIKVKELFDKGQCDGIISFGGVSNTTMATSVMKTLPFGIPKFMCSSSASMPAYAGQFMGSKDITMMHSVVDICDLNDLTKAMLERAAGGICGMVDASSGEVKPVSDPPLIAITTFKFAEACGQHVVEGLSKRGYNVIPCHANGIGDRAMDELIDQGLFNGVVDIVPAGVAEQLFGGNRASGPARLEAAARQGIPQVLAPSGFDMLSCGPLSRKDIDDPLWTSRNLAERKFFIPDEYRVQVRISADELKEIAAAVAEKLNRYEGPVKFLIPTRGWSTLSVEGADLHEPETDAVLAPALKSHLRTDIEVIEKDMYLNDPAFADELVAAIDAMMNRGEKG